MSTAIAAHELVRRWVSADEMRALGFAPGGPEIDYGLRWGEQWNVRVSFAPYGDGVGGYLYAHDRAVDRYLVLAAHTTADRVDAAWHELIACAAGSDGYLAFATLDGAAMPIERADRLLLHCVDRELAAHHDFLASANDEPVRFDAAYAVVVQRSARVAAEDLQIAAARAANPNGAAVMVRYRVLDASAWTGRVAGASLDSAAAQARRIQDVAAGHHRAVQATSVAQGHTTVAASRVPQLAFLAHGPLVPSVVPTLDL
jgi:hypothetical protein